MLSRKSMMRTVVWGLALVLTAAQSASAAVILTINPRTDAPANDGHYVFSGGWVFESASTSYVLADAARGAFQQFTLPVVPAASLQSAKLRVYVSAVPSFATSLTVSQLAASWTPATMAAAYPGPAITGAPVTLTGGTTPIGWKEFDVKTIVTSWLTTPSNNFGLRLQSGVYLSNNTGNFTVISSGNSTTFRPELVLVVPEPATIGLLGLGAVGFLARRRRTA